MHKDVLGALNIQPESFWSILQSIGTVFIIVLIMIVVLRIINRAMKRLSQHNKLSQSMLVLLRTMLRWLVYIAFVFVLLQQIGVEINSIWTLLTATAAMVAIGFVALWSILSNLLCTLLLIIFKPFQIGDTVELLDPGMTSGIKGQVKNINLIFTTLEESYENTSEKWKTQIPNNLFFQKIVRKKSGAQTISLEKQVFEEESLLNNGKED